MSIHKPGKIGANAEKFWRRLYDQRSALPFRHDTPAPWEFISEPLALVYLFRAVKAANNEIACAITVDLAPDVEAQARSQDHALKWLYRRCARRLKQKLGRDVPLVLGAEENDTRRLHLHGAAGVAPEEEAKVVHALKLAAGEWIGAGGSHQVKLTALVDDGWACYVAKQHLQHRPFIRKLLGPRSVALPTFPGGWIAAPQPIRRLARELYEADRRAWLPA